MYWDFILRYESNSYFYQSSQRFFALDHVNYARWMPVHIRDMKCLPDSVRQEFKKQGHWVISKTSNSFSAIAIDQAHEQENANVKGSGGCIGLTENPVTFKHWMVSGPDLARLQSQFKIEYLPLDDPEDPRSCQHHQNGLATQNSFQKQVNSLYNSTIQRMGNPFLDSFPELITLDSLTVWINQWLIICILWKI